MKPLLALGVLVLAGCVSTGDPEPSDPSATGGPSDSEQTDEGRQTGPGDQTESGEQTGSGATATSAADGDTIPAIAALEFSGAAEVGFLYLDRPVIALQAQPGAEIYQAEILVDDRSITVESEEPWIALEPGLLPAAGEPFTDVPAVTVRARALHGSRAGPWSVDRILRVRNLGYPLLEQLLPGQTVTFPMGRDNGRRDEQPRHAVQLTLPFAIGETELSNQQALVLLELMLAGGSVELREEGVVDPAGRTLIGTGDLALGAQYGVRAGTGEDAGTLVLAGLARGVHPVAGVTWFGASALAAAADLVLAPLPGDGSVRLPTEAEWEWSARASAQPALSDPPGRFPWGTGIVLNNQANFFSSLDPFETVREPWDARGGPTTPAGFYRGGSRGGYPTVSGRGQSGALDLIGNVWEWTLDSWDEDGYPANPGGSQPARVNPVVENGTLGPEGISRVVRGTAWNSRRDDVYPENRGSFPQALASHSIGVRLLLELDGTPRSDADAP